MDKTLWPPLRDDEKVRELIGVVQGAIIEHTPTVGPDGDREMYGPDLANVLLMILATVIEPYPVCATPAGMRRLAEAAGKELHQLMRDTRRVKTGDGHA